MTPYGRPAMIRATFFAFVKKVLKCRNKGNHFFNARVNFIYRY